MVETGENFNIFVDDFQKEDEELNLNAVPGSFLEKRIFGLLREIEITKKPKGSFYSFLSSEFLPNDEETEEEPDFPVSENPFIPDFAAKDIIFEDSSQLGAIRAGKASKIIEALTSKEHSDPQLIETFFFTYRAFSTPSDVLASVIKRFQELRKSFTDPYLTLPEVKEKYSDAKRVLEFVSSWVSHHYEELGHALLLSCQQWIEETTEHGFEKERQLDEETAAARNSLTEFLTSLRDSLKSLIQNYEAQISRTTSLKSHRDDSPVEDLGTYSSKELAMHFCLVDMDMLSSIKPYEFLNCGWLQEDKEKRSPNIVNFLARAQKIQDWVVDVVTSKPKEKHKSFVLKKLTKVAWELVKLQNFFSAMAILSGLKSESVFKLTESWKLVSKAQIQQLTGMELLFSADKNFNELKQQLDNIKPPAIPVLGIHLKDIVSIEQAAPKQVYGLINFHKYCMIANTIKEIKLYTSSPYSCVEVPNLKKSLLKLNAVINFRGSMSGLRTHLNQVAPASPSHPTTNTLSSHSDGTVPEKKVKKWRSSISLLSRLNAEHSNEISTEDKTSSISPRTGQSKKKAFAKRFSEGNIQYSDQLDLPSSRFSSTSSCSSPEYEPDQEPLFIQFDLARSVVEKLKKIAHNKSDTQEPQTSPTHCGSNSKASSHHDSPTYLSLASVPATKGHKKFSSVSLSSFSSQNGIVPSLVGVSHKSNTLRVRSTAKIDLISLSESLGEVPIDSSLHSVNSTWIPGTGKKQSTRPPLNHSNSCPNVRDLMIPKSELGKKDNITTSSENITVATLKKPKASKEMPTITLEIGKHDSQQRRLSSHVSPPVQKKLYITPPKLITPFHSASAATLNSSTSGSSTSSLIQSGPSSGSNSSSSSSSSLSPPPVYSGPSIRQGSPRKKSSKTGGAVTQRVKSSPSVTRLKIQEPEIESLSTGSSTYRRSQRETSPSPRSTKDSPPSRVPPLSLVHLPRQISPPYHSTTTMVSSSTSRQNSAKTTETDSPPESPKDWENSSGASPSGASPQGSLSPSSSCSLYHPTTTSTSSSIFSLKFLSSSNPPSASHKNSTPVSPRVKTLSVTEEKKGTRLKVFSPRRKDVNNTTGSQVMPSISPSHSIGNIRSSVHFLEKDEPVQGTPTKSPVSSFVEISHSPKATKSNITIGRRHTKL